MWSRRGFKEAVATVLKCCTAARDNIDDSFQREVPLRCTLRAWPTHCYTRRDRSRGIRDDVTSGEPDVVPRERTWPPRPVAQL